MIAPMKTWNGEDMMSIDLIPMIFVGSIFFALSVHLGVEYVRAKLSWND